MTDQSIPNGTRIRVTCDEYFGSPNGALGTVIVCRSGMYEVAIDGDLGDTWPFMLGEIEPLAASMDSEGSK